MTEKAVSDLRTRAKNEEPAVIISDLARLFPCLRNAHGIAPWKPEDLDEWALEEGAGAIGIVRLVLSVWSGDSSPWKVGPFKLSDLRTFDQTSMQIFQAWAKAPFWL